MADIRRVYETERKIFFTTGESLRLTGVSEIDNSEYNLRLTAKEGRFVINPDHVLYHVVTDHEEHSF